MPLQCVRSETRLSGSFRDAGSDRPRNPVIVKKYANRRLYDTEGSTYITLDDLATMVRSGRELVVYDARTGDDITRLVLTQIIMEEETRGRSILPTSFLRQLIGFYGDELQGVVPEYLEEMMRKFVAPERETPSPAVRAPVVETARRNVDTILERASLVFSPVFAAREAQEAERRQPSREELQAEIVSLKRELDAMRGRYGDFGAPRSAPGAPSAARGSRTSMPRHDRSERMAKRASRNGPSVSRPCARWSGTVAVRAPDAM